MSGGARHGIGVVIGLIVTPVIALCLMYGTNRATRYVSQFEHMPLTDKVLVFGVLLLAAVLLGLVMGSRLSPLASIVPGLAFAVSGGLWVLAPRFAVRHLAGVLPDEFNRGFMIIGPYGGLFVIGVALLVASVAPSRWKGHRRTSAPGPGYAAGPMGPSGAPYPPGAAPQPHARPQPPHQPPAQVQPQAYPQPHPQPQAYGPPPAPSAAAPDLPLPPEAPGPASEAPRHSSSPEDSEPGKQEPGKQEPGKQEPGKQEPGEWTRMYGGDELRGQ